MIKRTKEELKALKGGGKGFDRKTLAKLGVPWPPPKGWKKALLTGSRTTPKHPRSHVPDEWIAETRAKLLAKDNDAERHCESCLSAMGVRFEREYPVELPRGACAFIDFLVTGVPHATELSLLPCSVAIEIDGSSHMVKGAGGRDHKRANDILRQKSANVLVRIPHHVALKLRPHQWLRLTRSLATMPRSIVLIPGWIGK